MKTHIGEAFVCYQDTYYHFPDMSGISFANVHWLNLLSKAKS